MAAGELGSDELEQDVELLEDGAGARGAPGAVSQVAGVGLAVGFADQLAVEGRGEVQAALHPALEDRSLDGVAVEQPAAQKAQVTVLQRLAAAARGLLLPLVQLKAHVHEVVEDRAARIRCIEGIQLLEKGAAVVVHPLDFQHLRVLVVVPRGDGPWRQVAAVERGRVHLHLFSCSLEWLPIFYSNPMAVAAASTVTALPGKAPGFRPRHRFTCF